MDSLEENHNKCLVMEESVRGGVAWRLFNEVWL